MASLRRTWSISTSPRNPYKLPEELNLLRKFEGEVWNKDTQVLYAQQLSESDFFEGGVSPTMPDFSARDRVNRAPKTFGFVVFDKENRIHITDAGLMLIEQKRMGELFFRQLLKWQYPSPKHKGPQYENFKIKPFLEILRLIYEIEGMNKREIAMFCVGLIDYDDYDAVKNEILEFRSKVDGLSKVERYQLTLDEHRNQIARIYEEELGSGNYSIQGNVDSSISNFIDTKLRNTIDYADAAIRYFRATELFTLMSDHYRLSVIDINKSVIEEILDDTERQPKDYTDEEGFWNYMGDPYLPELPLDDKNKLIKQVLDIKDRLIGHKLEGEIADISEEFLQSINIGQLKDEKEKVEGIYQDSRLFSIVEDIQEYHQFDDIIEIFNKILNRRDIDIPDKPLFFEWNTWRALNMLDDGNIINNFKMDLEGLPLSTAPGRVPDIVCDYKDFVLVIEVTLSGGERQYETEAEPIARHLATVKRNLRQVGDERPVYGLFIAPSISEATIAHLFVIRRTEISYYGGKTIFIPMKVITFIKMLQIAKDNGGVLAGQIHNFIKWADSEGESNNDLEWFKSIDNMSDNWIKVA